MRSVFIAFASRLRATVNRGRLNDEAVRECEAHIERLTERNVRAGMTPEEARSAAQRQFGNATLVREDIYQMNSFRWLESVAQDVRYACRGMRRSPAFGVVAVLTLALGIGANTAIFSVVNAVLLRPLPYKDSDRLVRIVENIPPPEGSSSGPRRAPAALDADELAALRSHTKTLSHVGAYPRTAIWLNGPRKTTQLLGTRLSASIFPMLGAQPLMGRTFELREESSAATPVVVLSYGMWHRYFGGNPDILGKNLTLDGTSFSVIGVMPQGFAFPDPQTQFWIPFGASTLPRGVRLRVAPLARLKDGVSTQAATAEVSTILDQLRGNLEPGVPRDPETPPSFEIVRVRDDLVTPVRPALMVLAGSVAFVLLIACANVANLLLARTAARRQEIAVRLALGAARGRLFRQFLTESVSLAVIGGVAGTGLAVVGIRLLRTLATALPRRDLGPGLSIPRLDEVQIDASVLAFTLAVSVLTGLLFGVAPALGQSHREADALRDGGASAASGFNLFRRLRMQGVLVIAEIGIATMLLIGGGLLVHSFIKLSNVDPGYDATKVLTFQVPRGQYSSSELNVFADDLVVRLRSLPGVGAVGYAHDLPMMPSFPGMPLKVAPDASEPLRESSAGWLVSHDFLTVMGIPVVAGRGFGDQDRAGNPPVIVINQTLARRAFPGEDAVGKRLYSMGGAVFEVIGVVRDIRRVGLDQAPGPETFASSRQSPGLPRPLGLGPYFAVRTEGEPAVVASNIRAIVGQADPRASVENLATMAQILSNSISRPRLYAVLLGIFAGVAAALAGIGIYGVIAYSVAQRTREIGIRMALGATRIDVMRLVLGQSLPLIGIGLIVGLAGAATVTRYLQRLLFGLTPLDPMTFVGVSLMFGFVATLACYVPARRAMRVDPVIALRHE